jgi:hypothetical protein
MASSERNQIATARHEKRIGGYDQCGQMLLHY